ncbi:MAG: hypothetical protein CO186_09250 [Zetaproteobacteria bacterium CG_4_9_14_3_um_filter_49_83]|nr:MAG: hypothetical protein AUJ56_10915 [Zetaproteobacteria bacterium CG1_02_49_23]PIQ33542.1 MAG: hypothetical protein COW62_04925 [Zetaproteobacteria bacterium CG17_big_fil_post_rev_8_21_14_2_50_50_13]PIV29586.1 MAG: hypothetical protein COS35_11250 [Zetaproteobacteria bacterium CG02_land_8_20_14_3_00_50_9]PIY56370.1 MAG: hypothetical protein COZ00_04620 [Zetaproteobacteria bacterium CG_4_10_14_0_8_um_filter_49_80]PJA34767.1 MAG: hypothetical protein CO186_09250 [Zetaproteobacteria bacterium
MRTLEELVDRDQHAWPLVYEWLSQSSTSFELLPPSETRSDVLVALQVTTRSPMGAIAYETGGILVDHGWLRILGSGYPKLSRNIVDWSVGRAVGHLLIADDVTGGFFSINGGGLGEDRGSMYYWAPDTLKWEAMGFGYSDFFCWALSDKLAVFYEGLRWSDWEADVKKAAGDQCYSFYPFLWTKEGSIESSSRNLILISEQFAFNTDAVEKI